METRENPEEQRRCPTCGAELSGAAWFCGSCGTLLAAIPAEAMSDATRPLAAITATGAPDAAATPTTNPGTATETAAQRRCQRCGAANAKDAEACVSCGAALPQTGREPALPDDATDHQQTNETQHRHGLGRFFKRD